MTEGIIEKSSEDSHTYFVRRTPCEITLECVDYSVAELSGGYRVHHPYVRGSEIRKHLLPLDANPREPSTTPQVKNMTETLRDDPQNFFKKNNGMTTICKEVSVVAAVPVDPTRVTLKFDGGEGVCNGGHTYFALVTFPGDLSADAIVHLEVIELPENFSAEQKKQEIRMIARARNNNNRLAQRSEADFLGYYMPFRQALTSPTWVSWHEGDGEAVKDPPAMRADEYLRMLAALDPQGYRHPEYNPRGARHKTPVTQGKAVHSAWFNQTEQWKEDGAVGIPPLSHMAVLGDDLFRLRDVLAMTWLTTIPGSNFRMSSLYQDQIKGKHRKMIARHEGERELGEAPPPTLEVMLLGFFRTDIWLHMSGAVIDLVGWYLDPEELWRLRRADALDHLAAAFRDSDADPKSFIRMDTAYNFDLFTLGLGQKAPLPAIVVDVKTGTRYRKCPPQEATHYLTSDSAFGLEPYTGKAPESADVAFYRR